jgi:ankyrin repeat protein
MAMSEAAQLLADAFGKADCKALQLYIKRGYDACAKDQKQRTLLHLVASFSCSDCDKCSMARTLIKRGVQVDARDARGKTALMMCKSKSVAAVLLDHGAEVNAVSDHDTATCLIFAVQGGNLPLVQLYLGRGASLDVIAKNGSTALYAACERGDVDIVKALLAGGASARASLNAPPLLAAVMLTQRASAPCKSAMATLLLAKLLLQHGADVHATNSAGQTALMAAARDSSAKLVGVLLQAGASTAAACAQGKRALHYAAQHCDQDMLTLLLDSGADAAAACNLGELALHAASVIGSVEVGFDREYTIHLRARVQTSVTGCLNCAVLHHDVTTQQACWLCL